jgi:hypothetical protein
MVRIPPLGPALTALWHLLFELSDRFPGAWCLIGGQMVTLHGLEQGRAEARPTVDGDVLVDIRVAPAALRQVADFLQHRSLEPDPDPDGKVHRFTRPLGNNFIIVDVLAPDNVGHRADLTTSPPGRTLEVPGGTQALARVERVRVLVEGRLGEIPRPTILGAILIKTAAVNLPGGSERHLIDLAFVLSLLANPVQERGTLTASERTKLRACPLLDREHAAWRSLREQEANAGYAALRLLIGVA